MIDIIDIGDDAALLERFYSGLYLSELAAHAEPLDVWKWALWSGEAPYRLNIKVALADAEIAGGICYEWYPRSRCGLVTYLVVAPEARRHGLGHKLRSAAAGSLYGQGARAVFGEVNDPRAARHEPADVAWRRLERYQRWGSRVVDARYIQPALGPGLERDRGLLLLLHAGGPVGHIDGAVVRDFIEEFYEITEKATTLDPELQGMLDGIPDIVPLVELSR